MREKGLRIFFILSITAAFASFGCGSAATVGEEPDDEVPGDTGPGGSGDDGSTGPCDGGTGGTGDTGTGGTPDGGTGGTDSGSGGSDGGTGGGSGDGGSGGTGGGSDGGSSGCTSNAECPANQVCEEGVCVTDGDDDDGHDLTCKPNKTLLCHYPPGNPDNRHEICVGNPAVPAHLALGDALGSCP